MNPDRGQGKKSTVFTGKKGNVLSSSYKKAKHPVLCRLNESASFTISPLSLISAGFASLWMGLFTLFRPTPLILYLLVTEEKKIQPIIKDVVIIVLFAWQGAIMFVLIVLGFLLTLSKKIKKRSVLILHSWGLMILYLDVAVWIGVGLFLHLDMMKFNVPSKELKYIYIYFIVIYVESVCFCLLHYTYATYFIAAELTVIENFF